MSFFDHVVHGRMRRGRGDAGKIGEDLAESMTRAFISPACLPVFRRPQSCSCHLSLEPRLRECVVARRSLWLLKIGPRLDECWRTA